MKKYWIILLVLAVLVLTAACADNSGTETTGITESGAAATPTPEPDFSDTDFSGTWCVTEVLDSNGTSVTDSELEQLGADFSLELAGDGVYFVYDSGGTVLGQGVYSVSSDVLSLTADSEVSEYQIQDADTISATAEDGSVTVLTRCCTDTLEEGEQTSDEADTSTGDEQDTSETDTSTDDEQDTSETDTSTDDEQNTSETDAPATDTSEDEIV